MANKKPLGRQRRSHPAPKKPAKSTLPEHLENVETTATGKALIKARRH